MVKNVLTDKMLEGVHNLYEGYLPNLNFDEKVGLGREINDDYYRMGADEEFKKCVLWMISSLLKIYVDKLYKLQIEKVTQPEEEVLCVYREEGDKGYFIRLDDALRVDTYSLLNNYGLFLEEVTLTSIKERVKQTLLGHCDVGIFSDLFVNGHSLDIKVACVKYTKEVNLDNKDLFDKKLYVETWREYMDNLDLVLKEGVIVEDTMKGRQSFVDSLNTYYYGLNSDLGRKALLNQFVNGRNDDITFDDFNVDGNVDVPTKVGFRIMSLCDKLKQIDKDYEDRVNDLVSQLGEGEMADDK